MQSQWHNRRGQGRQSAPRDFWPGNFCWRIGKKEARKKGKRKKGENWKLRRKKGKLWKGRWKLELEVGKVIKRGEALFFFFFFAFHFWKQQKFVLGLPKSEFSTGKKHFTSGKKSGKITLPPQKNMPVMPLFKALSTTRTVSLIRSLLSWMWWSKFNFGIKTKISIASKMATVP